MQTMVFTLLHKVSACFCSTPKEPALLLRLRQRRFLLTPYEQTMLWNSTERSRKQKDCFGSVIHCLTWLKAWSHWFGWM